MDGFLLGYCDDLPAYELLSLILERRRAFERFLPQSFWEANGIRLRETRFEVGVYLNSLLTPF